MPAVSDGREVKSPVPSSPDLFVPLPHTWRPLGVRLAVVFFGVLLAVVFVMAWVGFSPETRATYTPFQIVTLGLLVVGGAGVGYGVARARVVASETGVVVVNGFRRHEVPWGDVDSVRLPAGAPWARMRLVDGRQVSLTAIQGSDGARARRAAAELAALVEARNGRH